MQVLEVDKPFEIQEITLSEWKIRPVKNNFFELVLVKDGYGSQCIDYNDYHYQSGSIFLLPPLKCHRFDIESPSKFIFLRFTDSFFKSIGKASINRIEWFKEASYILSNYNQLPGDIIKQDNDRIHLEKIVSMILEETQNYDQTSVSLIKSLMTSVLEILIRNIQKGDFFEVDKNYADERIIKILLYINEHIGQSDNLKVDHLAEVFSMSPSYVSEFFKKNVKTSLREYIIKARLRLVEIRLLNSDYTLSEIADELGFTDVSHLSKTFKRYSGVSPKKFKINGEYILLKRNKCSG